MQIFFHRINFNWPQTLGIFLSTSVLNWGSCLSQLHYSQLLTSELKLETAARTMIPQLSYMALGSFKNKISSYMGIIGEVTLSS